MNSTLFSKLVFFSSFPFLWILLYSRNLSLIVHLSWRFLVEFFSSYFKRFFHLLLIQTLCYHDILLWLSSFLLLLLSVYPPSYPSFYLPTFNWTHRRANVFESWTNSLLWVRAIEEKQVIVQSEKQNGSSNFRRLYIMLQFLIQILERVKKFSLR